MKKKHAIEEVKHNIQVDESLGLQKVGWKVQRVGWLLLFIFILISALGMFGNGMISHKKIGANGYEIEYQQYFRNEAEMKLTITANQNLTIDSISFPVSYLNRFKIESMIPAPTRHALVSHAVVYHFSPLQNKELILLLRPKEMGTTKGKVEVNNWSFHLSHFIFP